MKLSHSRPKTVNREAELGRPTAVGSSALLGVWYNFLGVKISSDGKRINCESNDADDQRIYARLETKSMEPARDDLNACGSSFDCRFDCLRHPKIHLYLGISPDNASETRKCHTNPRKLKYPEIIGPVTYNPPAHGNRNSQQTGCQCNHPVAKFILRLITPLLILHFNLFYRVHILYEAKTPNVQSSGTAAERDVEK